MFCHAGELETSGGSGREFQTVLAAGAVDGTRLPPFILYKGVATLRMDWPFCQPQLIMIIMHHIASYSLTLYIEFHNSFVM